MGWNINLKTDKPMTEEVVEEVIRDLPAGLRYGAGKQTWGWSLLCDVRLRSDTVLSLSGSYGMSGKIAEGAAEAFARRLEKRGFTVEVSPMH